MRNVETLLEEKIIQVSDEMEKYPVGSEERDQLSRDLVNLYDVWNNITKTRAEEIKGEELNELELEKLKFEKEKFEFEKESQKNNFWMWLANHGVTFVGWGLTWAFAVRQLIPFEQTGVPSSSMWRNGSFSKLNWFRTK